MNSNENYGDVDCLKSNIESMNSINSQAFCAFKSINLMDYSEDGQVEKRKKSYSNDIKLLSCDQTESGDDNEEVNSSQSADARLHDERPDKKQAESKETTKQDKSSLSNGYIEHEILNGLDTSLKTNLILCNSANIFSEIVEDVVEIADPSPDKNDANGSNSTTVEKPSVPSEHRLSIPDLPPPPASGKNLISTQMANQFPNSTIHPATGSGSTQTNKDLIDKNLISLATEKLLKNSQLEQIIKEQPLMQVEQLECILNSKTISELHENSRELIEQLSEQLDEQIDAQIEKHSNRDSSSSFGHDGPDKKPNKEKQIELIKEQLIERLSEPVIEQISDFSNSLITQQSSDRSKPEDSLENKTISQYQDETRDSQNTTPVDSEFSFKYSSNRTLLKDNSADYDEEVFDDSYEDDLNNGDESYLDRLKRLEEEQEHLNSSLIALTSHFAQVQLRLKQIVDASPERKENLLKELEEFAFRGIPDYRLPELEEFGKNSSLGDDNGEPNEHTPSCQKSSKLQLQRDKQKELILKLKEQLEDLESYAYETGNPNIIPSSMIMERQSVIIEQLKDKLPLELDKLEKMSPEELRKQIDKAIRDVSSAPLNNPIK